MSIFQFHKGTIKTSQSSYNKHPPYNFNSIKVQLKLVFFPYSLQIK